MKQKSLFAFVIVIYLVAAAGSYALASALINGNNKTPIASKSGTTISEVPKEPATEECPTNGVMYGKTAKALWEKRRPLGVVVENHTDSRPQSGISSADVVYEAVSEGGVTRTLSIFHCQDAKPVGPVRSARVHFINILREWGNNPLYAHVGGANCDEETGSGCGNGAPADALGLLRKLEWKVYNDMDQFSIPYPYYYRDYERIPDVATEHTVYASTQKLWEYASKNRGLAATDEDGLAWNSDWKSWKFVDAEAQAKRGNVKYISYDFYDVNAKEYGVKWEYDAVSNSYKRFHGNKPHIDKNTDVQISATNIFVITAKESAANDDYPGGHVVYDLLSGGELIAFQNGKVIKGTWEKEDFDTKMKFLDADGKEITIVRGQVWVSLLPKGNEVYSGSSPQAVTTDKSVESDTKSSKALNAD